MGRDPCSVRITEEQGSQSARADRHRQFRWVHCSCFSGQWTAVLSFAFPWISTLLLFLLSDSILSQMWTSLNINRTVRNDSGDRYHCLVYGLKGISANDSLFIMRLTYSLQLNECFFPVICRMYALFSGLLSIHKRAKPLPFFYFCFCHL